MARLLTSSDVLDHSIGGLSGLTYGTMAVIFKTSTLTGSRTLLGLHNSGGTGFQQYNIDGQTIGYWNGGNYRQTGNLITSTSTWYLLVVRKATSSVVARASLYDYSANTWTHAAIGTAISNATAPGAGGTARFRYETGEQWQGDIAVRAAWSNALPWTADAAGDALIEAAGLQYTLASWHAASPSALWLYDQSDVAQAVCDWTGGGGQQSSITGTAVTTASVPSIGYGDDLLDASFITAGLTTVNKDLSVVWDTRSAIGDDLNLTYDVRATLGDNLQALWDTKSVVSDNLQTVWDVRASIGDEVQVLWDARAVVSDNLQAIWDVRALVNDQVALLWDTRAAVGRDAVLLWEVRSAVGGVLVLSWDVRANLGDLLTLVWDTRAPTGHNLALLWDIESLAISVGKDLALLWSVQASVGDSLAIVYDVRSAIGDTLAVLWDTRAAVNDSVALLWDARVVVGDSQSLLWDVRAVAGDDLGLAWSISQAVGEELTLVWSTESLTPTLQHVLKTSVLDRRELGVAGVPDRWKTLVVDRWRTEVIDE